MSRTVLTETRSQQALQSYLDGLLQDAAIELADSVSQDEFQAAVLEEQLRDARISPTTRARGMDVELPNPHDAATKRLRACRRDSYSWPKSTPRATSGSGTAAMPTPCVALLRWLGALAPLFEPQKAARSSAMRLRVVPRTMPMHT